MNVVKLFLYTYEKRERKNNEQYGRPYEQITFRSSMFGYMTTIHMNIIEKKKVPSSHLFNTI